MKPKEIMFSVRMPRTLLEELKSLAGANHYMDVSEELRSIIREEFLQFNTPAYNELQLLRRQIENKLSQGDHREE